MSDEAESILSSSGDEQMLDSDFEDRDDSYYLPVIPSKNNEPPLLNLLEQPASSSESPLLNLPERVRHQIWRLVSSGNEALRRAFSSDVPQDNGPANILCLSRALYYECVPIFYSENSFHVRCPLNLSSSILDGHNLSIAQEESISRHIGIPRAYLSLPKLLVLRLPSPGRSTGSNLVDDHCSKILCWLFSRARQIRCIELRFYHEGHLLPNRGPEPWNITLAEILTRHKLLFAAIRASNIGRVHIAYHVLYQKPAYVRVGSGTYRRALLESSFPRSAKWRRDDDNVDDEQLSTIRELAFNDAIYVKVSCTDEDFNDYYEVDWVGREDIEDSRLSCLQWLILRDIRVLPKRKLRILSPYNEDVTETRRSSLLSLPPEIRTLIWAYCSSFNDTLTRYDCFFSLKRSSFPLPATSRQIEQECTKLFYHTNDFCVDVVGGNFHSSGSKPTRDEERSAILGFPLRFLPHLKSLVLFLDSEEWFNDRTLTSIKWLLDRAPRLEKVKMTFYVDKMPRLLGFARPPEKPTLAFESLLRLPLSRQGSKLLKVLYSSRTLRILDITIGDWDYMNFLQNKAEVRAKPHLHMIGPPGIDAYQVRGVFSAWKIAFGGIFTFADEIRDCLRAWRWIMELHTSAKRKLPLAIRYEDLFFRARYSSGIWMLRDSGSSKGMF